MQYSQTNGTLIKKGGGKKIVVEQDSGEDEEIEEIQTIITKKITRKKGKKTYVRFEKFLRKEMQCILGSERGKLCHCLESTVCGEVASVVY